MTETALLNACRTLFGEEVNLNRDFLFYLQPTGAKLAYRSQVKLHHPDRFSDAPQHIRQQQTERFREIHQAYDLLKSFLDQRHFRRLPPSQPTAKPNRRPAATRTAKARPSRPAQPRGSAVPTIPMEFGMYAYYQGKVTYQDLIEALVWQRRQRPAMGAIAKKWGWLSDAQIRRTLEHRGRSQRFGKKAMELGYLSTHQVDTLIRHQQSLQQRLGQYFVSKGLISAQEADQMANGMKSHNIHINQRKRRKANNKF